MSSSSNGCCQRCLTQSIAEVVEEKWPDENNTILRFCSKQCLDEYKLEILKKETMFCLSSKSIGDVRFEANSSSMRRNAMKRHLNDNAGDKRRKKHKEPRPHPSYRLNKRYWDDIRAGRRTHDMPSCASTRSPPAGAAAAGAPGPPKQSSRRPISLLPFPTTTQMAHHHHLSFPLLGTCTGTSVLAGAPRAPVPPPPLPHACISFAFSSAVPSASVAPASASVSAASTGLLAENGLRRTSATSLEPKVEVDDFVDVTSCDDDADENSKHESANSDPVIHRSGSGSGSTMSQVPMNSCIESKFEPDTVVDQIAEDMFAEVTTTMTTTDARTPETKCENSNEKKAKNNNNYLLNHGFTPIPIPIPVPILIPLSESFILKYFNCKI